MKPTHSEIRKLSPDIVRLIAAGEVIERPASVVKELIENSLDAGARHIEVRLANGGMSSIVVKDDGCGIPSGQVPLLLERHTTSKISEQADLESIITLGFRGEALYSIAAAGDVILTTRFTNEDAGTRLISESNSKKIETVPWPGGTQVETLRLFHSTPARRKFLKSETAEYTRVAELVSAYALAYPDVAWKVEHNGRKTVQTPGTGNPDDALIAVYGAATARMMLKVDFERGPVKITGTISSIELHRARRSDQIIFLNGRFIKDAGITAAFERPYLDFLPPGRRPVIILKIECDPSEVDVNVHPHKREVRLANPRLITSAVYHAVLSTLERDHPLYGDRVESVSPKINIDEATGEVIPQYQNSIPHLPNGQSQTAPIVFDEREWAIREPKRKHSGEWDVDPHRAQQTKSDFRSTGTSSLPHEYPQFSDLELEDQLPPVGNTVQFANTYLLYNQGKSVYLIDQHNLHERILYEEFMNRERTNDVLSQTLLFPVQVNLSPSLASLVNEHIDEIRNAGFDIEEFSDPATGVSNSFVLRSVPHVLAGGDPSRAFVDIIERVGDDEDARSQDGFRRGFVVNLSCKSAIKAGQKLSEPEIEYLISHIGDGTYYTCPHGRPTIIRLDEDWFRRVFKRSAK